MPAGESPSRSIPATRWRISASVSVATLPGALSVAAGLRGRTLPRSAQYVRGSLRATSSRYAAPPSLSKETKIASRIDEVSLLGVPFARPVTLLSSAIVALCAPNTGLDSSFPFLPIRTFCAFRTCHPSLFAPTLHQVRTTWTQLKPSKPMKLSTKQQIQTIASVMRAIDPTITALQALSTARYVLNHRFAGDYTKALEHAHDPYLVNGIICW